MDPFYLGVASSFFLGLAGYITARMILIPIWRYKQLKKRIHRLSIEDPPGLLADRQNDWRSAAKTLAHELDECFSTDLPAWYQLALKKKEEDPGLASRDLAKLAKTKKLSQAQITMAKIRNNLNLP